jgi:phage terminase large subunit-like protein
MVKVPELVTSESSGKLIERIDERSAKLEQISLLSEKIKLQEGLPHIHGWKFYKWAQEYMDSRAKHQFLCAANQISKSSTQIRKSIHWATATELWDELWLTKPLQFWYLYPTRDVAHVEYMKKWVPEFLPRGEFRHDHPQYGWKPEIFHGRVFAIHFNAGPSIYFKSYAQDVQDLQTGTVWWMGLDEETPEELFGELSLRLAATDGYMSAVFTPTLGQEFWRRIIEEKGKLEKFPNAFKRQVSMYDCLYYGDGSRSPWTVEKIQRAEMSCKSQAEIDMRVHGKFRVAEGLKYPAFHRNENVKKGHPVPKTWMVFVGVDIGSGGDNHPSAISIVAVSPDFSQGRVIDGWRGDDQITTANDVVLKASQMIQPYKDQIMQISYDFACRDFYTIATEMGLPVEAAEKSHAIGETTLNALFKSKMLYIYDVTQLDNLVIELSSLKHSTSKKVAKDDFIDSLRYAVSRVPWNWDALVEKAAPPPDTRTVDQINRDEEIKARRGQGQDNLVDIDQEIEEWNQLMT